MELLSASTADGGTGMVLLSADTLRLESDEHMVIVRQAVRQLAIGLGFSLVDQTKIVTAASELARNTRQARRRRHGAARDDQRRSAARRCG